MKKHTIKLILALCLFLQTSFIQAQTTPEWVKTFGGSIGNYSTAIDMANDNIGNVYVAGYFDGTANLNPNLPDFTSVGGQDLYIQKLDTNGNFLWTKTFGGANAAGQPQIHKICTDMLGNIYITGSISGLADMDPGVGVFNITGAGYDVFILKLDANGNFVWAKTVGGAGYDDGRAIAVDGLGNVHVTGMFTDTVDFDPGSGVFNLTAIGQPLSDYDIFILKLDSDGNFIWAKSINDINDIGGSLVGGITVDAFGNVYTIGASQNGADFDPGVGVFNLTGGIFISKLNASGDFVWAKNLTFPATFATSGNYCIATDLAENVYIGGSYSSTIDFDPGVGVNNQTTLGSSDAFIEKLDANGNMLWVNIIGGTSNDHISSITLDASGHLFVAGYYSETVDFDPGIGVFNMTGGNVTGQADAFIEKLDNDGHLIWAKAIRSTNGAYSEGLNIDNSGTIYMLGNFMGTADFDSGIDTLNVTSVGIANNAFVLKLRQVPNNVYGQVVLDSIANCMPDSSERGLEGLIIQFANNLQSFYALTDSLGFYEAYVDTGIYTVSVVNASPYSLLCPSSQQAIVDLGQNAQTINWVLQNTIECPYLVVDIAAPFLRMTGGGSYYIVSYCNNGTEPAANAYVEVEIDPALNVLGASIPITNQNGQIYTFNLGNLAVGQCGSFLINVLVDTATFVGQTHCTEAHIYPDSICTPVWSGAILNTTGNCLGDSIYFIIQNIGAAMNAVRQYYVVEDNIMMRTDTFTLGNGQTTTIIVDAIPGKTYRIIAEQEIGFPAILGDDVATAVVEGCVLLPNGHFNTGFVTQFSNGNSSPYIAVDCQQNIAAFDPNDKAAQPEGYDATSHYIYNYTDLDYKIRFQNTGNDTAFTVVVRDTISPYLDPATIEMGASSHPYTWRLYGQGILELTFNNIMLPDSNINEPASHGFFRYRIKQNPNNQNGTVIYNTAAIYFDFNPPVMTNTTWHTVGENFVLTVAVDKIFDEAIAVKVYPNPFTHSATIEVQGKEYEELQLTVFDLTGREIAQERAFYSNKIELTRGNLQTGIYVYKLESNGKMISSGKIVVQ